MKVFSHISTARPTEFVSSTVQLMDHNNTLNMLLVCYVIFKVLFVYVRFINTQL